MEIMLPLSGWRIATTRPEAQAKEVTLLLQGAGATVFSYPLLEIRINSERSALLEAVQVPAEVFLFTSANGVQAYVAAANRVRKPLPIGTTAYCVGKATAKEARAAGFLVAALPDVAAAENLPQLMGTARVGTRVVCIRGNLADETLPATLKQLGYTVVDAVGYETRLTGQAEPLFWAASQGQVDVITFFSGSAVHALLQERQQRLPKACRFAVVGPKTEAELAQYGYQAEMMATTASAVSLVEAIIDFASNVMR